MPGSRITSAARQRNKEGVEMGMWHSFRAWMSPADLVVSIQNGHGTVLRGRAKSDALNALDELTLELGVEKAMIYISEKEHGYQIEFSGIDAAYHQRFRNVWHANAT